MKRFLLFLFFVITMIVMFFLGAFAGFDVCSERSAIWVSFL